MMTFAQGFNTIQATLATAVVDGHLKSATFSLDAVMWQFDHHPNAEPMRQKLVWRCYVEEGGVSHDGTTLQHVVSSIQNHYAEKGVKHGNPEDVMLMG